MPHENISVDDKNISYGLFHRRTSFKKGSELFPRDGKPSPYDIKQGYTDLDCYFLSVLSSLANTPEGIRLLLEAFPDYSGVEGKSADERRAWFDEQKKITVSFYKPYGNGDKISIKVDKTAMRSKGAAWVRILEKAFAVYKIKFAIGKYFDSIRKKCKKGGKINSRTTDGIRDADSALCAAAFTGEQYSSGYYKNMAVNRGTLKKFSKDDYSGEVLEVFDDIEQGVKSHKSVVASASKGIKIYSKGLFLHHVYTIVGVNEKGGKKFIIVRNPYSGRSRVYKEGKDKKMHSKVVTHKEEEKQGVSELELNDFCKYFESYTIGAKEILIS